VQDWFVWTADALPKTDVCCGDRGAIGVVSGVGGPREQGILRENFPVSFELVLCYTVKLFLQHQCM